MATFGQRLRQYRVENGLTQDDIAAMLGTVKQVISGYELGNQIPKIDMLGDLSDKLGVNPLWLMGRDVSMKSVKQSDTIETSRLSPTVRAIIDSATRLSEDDAAAIARLLRGLHSDEKTGDQ